MWLLLCQKFPPGGGGGGGVLQEIGSDMWVAICLFYQMIRQTCTHLLRVIEWAGATVVKLTHYPGVFIQENGICLCTAISDIESREKASKL